MEDSVRQKYEAIAEESVKEINSNRTLHESDKIRVRQYAESMKKKLAMICDFDRRRTNWMRDLEEHGNIIGKVLAKIPKPKQERKPPEEPKQPEVINNTVQAPTLDISGSTQEPGA